MESVLVNVLKNRSENISNERHSLEGSLFFKDSNCQQEKAKVTRITGELDHRRNVEDLTTLNPLTDKQVLNCLEERFNGEKIWSKAGVTLVAVNPFKDIRAQYGEDVVQRYHSQSSQQLPPHIFAIAEKAYSSMMLGLDSTDQSIIVSGESGAGKTWSARCLMNYLTSLAEYNPGGFSPSPVHCIEQRILDSNPILEAFGNASTMRNHNSSRFGKYIQLQFDRSCYIIGASIQTYLLEKTRVIHQNHAEKNFHIFYQMSSGATLEERLTWGISQADGSSLKFTYLPQSYLYTTNNLSTEFQVTRQAMKSVGLTEKHQEKIFKILSGILHIGNLEFIQDEDDDSCDLNDEAEGVRSCLKCCCSLLGLKEDVLRQYLTVRKISANHSKRKSIFMKPCTKMESVNRRDCIGKVLYSRLFDWLVAFLNKHTATNHGHSFIGLLDIYGFESFHTNSLEQLCINYANEKLQQHFVSYFLKAEQEEYKKEGISWDFCEFTNNKPCLDAIEGQISIFGLMNEECQMNRTPNPMALQDRILGTICGNHVKPSPKSGKKRASFLVKHYAGDVIYCVDGLVEKNKDFIPPDLIEMLACSKILFIRTLIQKDFVAGQKSKGVNGKGQAKTVVTKFKNSLSALMTTLRNTSPHYIRCIKPNTQCVAGVFDKEYVANQLKACGVMETITISKAGYPYKISFDEFAIRYKMLSGVTTSHAKDKCSSILETVFGEDDKENEQQKLNSEIKVGITKVFLREQQLNHLESQRNKLIVSSVLCMQRAWRHYRQRKQGQKQERAACIIQAVYRGWRVRCHIQKMHEAAQVIQHAMLMYSIRKEEEKIAMEMRWLEELKEVDVENDIDILECSMDQQADDSLLSPVEPRRSSLSAGSLISHMQVKAPSLQGSLFGRHQYSTGKTSHIETIRSLDDEIDGDEEFELSEEEDNGIDNEDLNVTQEECKTPSEGILSLGARIVRKPTIDLAIGAVMVGLLLSGPLGV